MLTAFGKVLRIIRINNNEILKDMAQKLGVTTSYLSAVETGKRNIPHDWSDKIIRLYGLNPEESANIKDAGWKSTNQLKIDIKEAEKSKREMALEFARKFDDLSEEEIRNIMFIVTGGK